MAGAVADTSSSEPPPCAADEPQREDCGDRPASTGPSVSKRQQKKMLKREKMLESRAVKRLDEKRRRKERRAALKDAGMQPRTNPRKALKRRAAEQQEQESSSGTAAGSLRIAVDFAYDELMSDNEIRKSMAQLGFCYAAIRRAEPPAQLHFVHLQGRSASAYDSHGDRPQWTVRRHAAGLTDVFAAAQCVYLTGDSDNVVDELDPDKVYVIGGLLDHNRHKGASLAYARQLGVQHARLPIDRYMKLESRSVLAINHVCEILLMWMETRDWQSAFVHVIPKRKGVGTLSE